jgi:hypothetical protein
VERLGVYATKPLKQIVALLHKTFDKGTVFAPRQRREIRGILDWATNGAVGSIQHLATNIALAGSGDVLIMAVNRTCDLAG